MNFFPPVGFPNFTQGGAFVSDPASAANPPCADGGAYDTALENWEAISEIESALDRDLPIVEKRGSDSLLIPLPFPDSTAHLSDQQILTKMVGVLNDLKKVIERRDFLEESLQDMQVLVQTVCERWIGDMQPLLQYLESSTSIIDCDHGKLEKVMLIPTSNKGPGILPSVWTEKQILEHVIDFLKRLKSNCENFSGNASPDLQEMFKNFNNNLQECIQSLEKLHPAEQECPAEPSCTSSSSCTTSSTPQPVLVPVELPQVGESDVEAEQNLFEGLTEAIQKIQPEGSWIPMPDELKGALTQCLDSLIVCCIAQDSSATQKVNEAIKFVAEVSHLLRAVFLDIRRTQIPFIVKTYLLKLGLDYSSVPLLKVIGIPDEQKQLAEVIDYWEKISQIMSAYFPCAEMNKNDRCRDLLAEVKAGIEHFKGSSQPEKEGGKNFPTDSKALSPAETGPTLYSWEVEAWRDDKKTNSTNTMKWFWNYVDACTAILFAASERQNEKTYMMGGIGGLVSLHAQSSRNVIAPLRYF